MKHLLKKLYSRTNLYEDELVLAGYLAMGAFHYLSVEMEESFLSPLFPSIPSQKFDNWAAFWATLNMLGRNWRWTVLLNCFDYRQVFEVS